jgi:hypothetical protein
MDGSGLLEPLLLDMPVPAVRFDGDGNITAASTPARGIVMDTSGSEPEGSSYFQWICEEQRSRIRVLHEQNRTADRTVLRYSTLVSSKEGARIPLEVTALPLHGTGDTLAFLTLSPGGDEKQEETRPDLQALLSMLEEKPGDDDLFRWILEFVRRGTGASGASCRLEGRTITVGDVPLDDGEADGITSTEINEVSDEGLLNLTVPVRHRYGLLNLRLFGLPPDGLGPFQRLILKLAPLFIDYTCGISSVTRVMKTFSSIIEFWTLLSDSSSSLDNMLRMIADISHSDSVLLSVLREGESVLEPVSGFGFSGELPLLQLGDDTAASWAYTHSELTYTADSGRDSRFMPVFPGAGSELAIPLLREGRAVGTLVASSRHRGGYTNPVPSLITMIGIVLSLWLFGGTGKTADHAVPADDQGNGAARARTDSMLLALSKRLKSPLAALSANIDFLEGGRAGELSDEQAECLKSMGRSTGDLATHCERLLTFMRLDLQDDAGDSAWGVPGELIASMLPGFRERAALKDVSVKAVLPEESFSACFDPVKMTQIVWNLVENAITFNHPGGEVSIEVSQEGEIWTLEVSDTGRGISSSELPYIFDSFHRHARSGDSGSGPGIGLAIVKHFTELQGGVISVWSSQDAGSRFLLRFPVSG